MAIETCKGRGCTAQIEFAANAEDVAAGKPRPRSVPLDADRSGDPLGGFAVHTDDITGQLLYRSAKPGTDLVSGESRRVSHYTTCPDAASFSRRRK